MWLVPDYFIQRNRSYSSQIYAYEEDYKEIEMKKLIIALAAVFFFAASAQAVTLKRYERLLRDTALQGQQGFDKQTKERVSFLKIDRGDTIVLLYMYPKSGKVQLHVIKFLDESDDRFTVGAMTDKDLDGAPDHYQTMNYDDGVGMVTYEGDDTVAITDLWEYWITQFIHLTNSRGLLGQ